MVSVFFNSKDLSELTTNLIGDCSTLEHVLSHLQLRQFKAPASHIVSRRSSLFLDDIHSKMLQGINLIVNRLAVCLYSNVVFSEEQYHNMYKDIYNWSNIKQIDILQENTCLFVGCSLSDPNTRRLLDIAYKEGETRHYAIMKKEEIKLPEGICILQMHCSSPPARSGIHSYFSGRPFHTPPFPQ